VNLQIPPAPKGGTDFAGLTARLKSRALSKLDRDLGFQPFQNLIDIRVFRQPARVQDPG
jgi:hypothetical protein